MKNSPGKIACLVISATIAGALVTACDPLSPQSPSDAPTEVLTPAGQRALEGLEGGEIDRALAAAEQEINQARPLGVVAFVAAMKQDLAARGLDGSALDTIRDIDGPTADPMPGGTIANPSAVGSQSMGLGVQRYGLEGYDHEHFACPILAPEGSAGTTCSELVATVLADLDAALTEKAEQVRDTIEQNHSDLSDPSLDFVTSWAMEAEAHGAQVAAIYAGYLLAAASQCDTHANAHTVALRLGREQGWQIVDSQRAWAISQLRNCAISTDRIAEEVRRRAKASISGYMKDHIICADVDFNQNNPAIFEAEVVRKEGIQTGIDERVEILRTEMFQQRRQIRCPRGTAGDPLVIDLAGDGLALGARRVAFDLLGDGAARQVRWVGAEEGLVAIDLDGDGAITSSRELMSDRGECDGGRCFDGVANLALYDQRDRGGNADGMIDARDSVFARLRVWVDRDQDGVSQPDELAGFAAHGIIAIALDADRCQQRRGGATLTSRLQVLTHDGFRDAYDAWLGLELSPSDLSSLMPPR